MLKISFMLALLLTTAAAFVPNCRVLSNRFSTERLDKLSMKLDIEVSSTDAVSSRLCSLLATAAIEEIEAKGKFYFAIPGGSILKMLGQGESEGIFIGVDWSKATMGWVNHRAVPLDDESSTEFKAGKLFLDSWKSKGLKVLSLAGSTDAVAEANRMEALLALELPSSLSTSPSSTVAAVGSSSSNSYWDLMLIGVGLDGHVGSLYPHSDAVRETRSGVLSVVKPTSSSISLTLTSMQAAKRIVVASAGKSEKYPLGKAEGMFRALQQPGETVETFPAAAFRETAKWLLDEGAASMLQEL